MAYLTIIVCAVAMYQPALPELAPLYNVANDPIGGIAVVLAFVLAGAHASLKLFD